MPKRTYKVGNDIYDIEDSQVSSFLKDMPKAVEVKSFTVGKDTYDIAVKDVPAFLKDMPDAKPLYQEDVKKKDGTTPSSTGATRPFGTTSVYPSGETKPTFPSESTPKEYDPVGRIKLYSESIKHAQARLPKLVAGYNAAVASGDEIGAANFKTEINNTSGRISELEKRSEEHTSELQSH